MKIYHLSTCSTCKRILKELKEVFPEKEMELIDIKQTNISEDDLDKAHAEVGSYLELFNKRARKIATLKITLSEKSEDELKSLILGEYSFLKRPLIFFKDKVYAGNSKKTIEALKEAI